MASAFLQLALVGEDWVLWLLLLASVVSLSVMYERWRAFRLNHQRAAGLEEALVAKLNAKDLKGALDLVGSSPSAQGRVAYAGLERSSQGPDSAQEAMLARLIVERRGLDKNLIVLGTLGNNAPFIGLFGTVLGVIRAFHDLALTGNSGVSVVMTGISQALVATAFGILVAIPAVVANNYFRTLQREALSEAEELMRLVLAHLKRADR